MVSRIIVAVAVIAYGLHQLWESFHVSLYGGYEHLTTLPITVYATLGDVAYTIGAYLFIALLKRDMRWPLSMARTDIAALAFMGMAISLFVEYRALAQMRWFYLDAMPLIPGLGVGLSPVVQMTMFLPLTFILVQIVLRRIGRPVVY
jgi:hypothetical protein